MNEDSLRAIEDAGTVQERVARGVAYLDRVRPEWELYLSASYLDMGDCYKCVLGQLFGDFWYYVEGAGSMTLDESILRGFDSLDIYEYNMLEDEWIRVLQSRLKERVGHAATVGS